VLAQPLAQQAPVVALQQLLRDALELEQQHVPGLLALLDRGLRERARVPDRKHDEPLDPLGNERRQPPRHRGPEVVADDLGALDAERIQHGDHVGDAVPDRVVGDVLGLRRVAEAAQVGCDDALAGRDERGDLVAPQPVGVREAVDQQDGRALALVLDRQRDAVAGDLPQHQARARRSAAPTSSIASRVLGVTAIQRQKPWMTPS
jgi:hypothetical protein